MDYIICNHKKSNPKINVLVCEKCRYRRKCADYNRYIQPSLFPGFAKEMINKKTIKPKRVKLKSTPLSDKQGQLSLEIRR
jgi:hypothetical protein